jgi:DNA-binding CsgD family transcriptional regulator
VEFPDLLYGIDDKYEATQGMIRKKFRSDKTLFLKEREGKILHVYGFQATVDQVAMTQVYVNHLALLRTFIQYFKEEAAPILSQANENKVHIAPECGQDFLRVLPTDASIKNKQINRFLHQLGEETIDCMPAFSPREKACIHWLLRGRTAQQIAWELGLSKRTVEHYIENAKGKLGCQSKTEFIDCLHILTRYFSFSPD